MADPTNSDEARAIADSITLEWGSLALEIKGVLGDIQSTSGGDMLMALGISGDDEIFATVASSTIAEALARAADLVGKRVLENGDIVENPDAEYAITDSTRDMLAETISDAIEQGLSPGALRDQIMDGYGFSASRALNIARTERSFAQNRGAMTAAKESGVVETKRWDVANSDQDCDICMANADQGSIPLDDDFDSGDPAPPAHPNCRCVVTYGTKGGDEEVEEPDAPADESGEGSDDSGEGDE